MAEGKGIAPLANAPWDRRRDRGWQWDAALHGCNALGLVGGTLAAVTGWPWATRLVAVGVSGVAATTLWIVTGLNRR